jgi:hypothetical protein
VTLDGGKEWKKFMNGMPSVRVDDILIHPRDRDLIVGTHGRSIWIADDISALEQIKPAAADKEVVLFDPRPAILWKNDPQAQRHAANREFQAKNPQGGTAINVWAKSDLGKGKVEFLQGANVVSTMEVDLKAGMNRYQWAMRGPAGAAANTAGAGNGRGGRRGGGGAGAAAAPPATGDAPPAAAAAAAAPAADQPAAGGGGGGGGRRGGQTGVPFVAAGGRGGGGGGGGGGFGGFGAAQGPLLEPGTYMVKLTVGDKVVNSSVVVMEDIWMRPQ